MIRQDDYEFLRFTFDGDGVLLVEMNRPEARNAMHPPMHTEVSKVWNDIAGDDRVRVVVITGAGSAFSLGGVPEELAVEGYDAAHLLEMMKELFGIVNGMVHLPQPVISAVNGTASASGLATALSADISIVSETAKMIDPHVLGGLVAGDHAVLLWPLLCGMAKAKYYLFSGEVFTGAEAERIGLVSRAVPEGEVLDTAMELAHRLGRGSQVALRLTKRALNGWFQVAAPLFENSAALEMLSMLHPDAAEGIAAARGRRPPDFPSTRPTPAP